MRFLRPAVSFAMAVAFHVPATGLAHADESPPPSPANADTTFPKTGSAPEFSPAPTAVLERAMIQLDDPTEARS
jgi:hypothetical protein